jgi:Flp pilus assembly protein TadD
MINHALIASLCLLCGGLAACVPETKETPPPSGKFREFYDTQAALIYGTEFPPSSPQEAVLNGDRAWQEGDLDRALFEYVRALDLDPTQAGALYKIGRIHRQKNNLALTERAYRWTLELQPGHAGASEGLGLLWLQKRAYPQAEEMLKQAAQADPNRWEAHNGLGVIADLRGDYAAAQAHYQAALALLPNSPQLLNNLGYSHYLARHWPEALQALQQAVSHDPGYAAAWHNLGLLYARMQRYDDAAQALRHVMNDAQAYNDIGYVCMMDGHYDSAENFFQEAISRAPSYYPTAQENFLHLKNLRKSGAPPKRADSPGLF